MKLAVLLGLGVSVIGLGVWLLIEHETGAALALLLTIPVTALRIARGGGCGMRCGRSRGHRGAGSDVFVG